MTPREERGLQIAATTKLSRKGQNWIVPSQSGNGKYTVIMGKEPRCNCPDFEFRGLQCKHIHAVEYAIKREFNRDGSETVTETVKVTYSQDWKSYNASQTNEKQDFQVMLSELCKILPEPPKTTGTAPGGRKPLPFSDMTFSAVFKVYSTVSARRFASDLKAAHEKRFISKAPHFNSVLNHLEREELTTALKELITQSSLPLASIESQFAVDSSGFSTSKLINWNDTKYKGHGPKEHDWIKAHLMCGVQTNVVTAVEIGARHTHDSVMFPYLVKATAQNFNMVEVSADKGYTSKRNMELVDGFGATPYIPFKKNTVMRNDGDVWSKMYHYFAFNKEDFLAHYHQRSNVETTFHMIKAKFGGYVRSKTPTAQINEVLCKILAHNICCLISAVYELGIEPRFCADLTLAQNLSQN